MPLTGFDGFAYDTGLIEGAFPRILTRTDLFANMHFDGAISDPPPSWTKTGTGLFTSAAGTTYWDRGSGFTKQTALSLNLVSGNVVINQISAAGVVVLNEPWVLQCLVYPFGASVQVGLRIDTLDGADVIVETPGVSSQNFTLPLANAWQLVERIVIPTDPDGTKFKVFLIQPANIGVAIQWAYVHFGLLSDFEREFSRFRVRDRQFVSMDDGGQASAAAELKRPAADVTLSHAPVYPGTTEEAAWRRAWKDIRTGMAFSLWRNRLKWRNREDHFFQCVRKGKLVEEFEPGGRDRFNVGLDAMIPAERKQPDHEAI